MITVYGERFLLSNLKNENNKLSYFALGTNAQLMKKDINMLGTEKLRKEPSLNFDVQNNVLEYSIKVNGDEFKDCNELGLFTKDNELVCYHTFEKITHSDSTEIELIYTISLTSDELINKWLTTSETDYTYEVKIPHGVVSVYEEDSLTGYKKMDNKPLVEETEASYYYDSKVSRLYIHCADGEDPNNKSIWVRSD